MRAAELPSLRGLISTSQPLRVNVAKACDQARVNARRSTLGYSDAAAELDAFFTAALDANRRFVRADSIAQTLGTSGAVDVTDQPKSTVSVTATWTGTSIAESNTTICAPAVGTITIAAGNAANGNTVTIGSRTYTFQTVLTNVDGNVLIGVDASATATNLARAINDATTGLGTTHATATTPHPKVYAVAAAGVVAVGTYSLDHQVEGNAITMARVGANITLSGATLSGGVLDRFTSWTSGTPAAATVDDFGTITAVAAGSSSITASFHGRTNADTVTVNA